MFTEMLDTPLALGSKTVIFIDKTDKQPGDTYKHDADSNKDFSDEAYEPNSRR